MYEFGISVPHYYEILSRTIAYQVEFIDGQWCVSVSDETQVGGAFHLGWYDSEAEGTEAGEGYVNEVRAYALERMTYMLEYPSLGA